MILDPGTFKVSKYRKQIPERVKLQVLLDHIRHVLDNPPAMPSPDAHGRHHVFCYECGVGAGIMPSWRAEELQFDHDPALVKRPYDTSLGDFVPKQHDPKYIVVRYFEDHLHKTTGRKPGAARTITTRGSDVGEAARSKDILTSDAVHRAKLASKAGHYQQAARILSTAPRDKLKRKTKIAGSSRWPARGTRKIPSRPFPSNRSAR